MPLRKIIVVVSLHKYVTYCVVYKHCYVILYRILDTTIILGMEYLSKIYHILFKPAINYNYYADTIKE